MKEKQSYNDVICVDKFTLHEISHPTSFKECLKLKLHERLPLAMKKAWTSGVGLAAIQIGIPKRFAYYMLNGSPRFLLNPRILRGFDSVASPNEGCLSVPKQRFNLYRFNRILYTTEENGQPVQKEATGFEAHVIQHEVDHMEGCLVCDTVRTKKPKAPGRNEPCYCGSNLKFKRCCYEKGLPYPEPYKRMEGYHQHTRGECKYE